MKAISSAGLKITPDVLVSGGGEKGEGGGGGLVQLLLANMLQSQRPNGVPKAPEPPAK